MRSRKCSGRGHERRKPRKKSEGEAFLTLASTVRFVGGRGTGMEEEGGDFFILLIIKLYI